MNIQIYGKSKCFDTKKAERYMPQLHAYAGALSRIYEMPVKAKYLYFFQLGRFVEV